MEAIQEKLYQSKLFPFSFFDGPNELIQGFVGGREMTQDGFLGVVVGVVLKEAAVSS